MLSLGWAKWPSGQLSVAGQSQSPGLLVLRQPNLGSGRRSTLSLTQQTEMALGTCQMRLSSEIRALGGIRADVTQEAKLQCLFFVFSCVRDQQRV